MQQLQTYVSTYCVIHYFWGCKILRFWELRWFHGFIFLWYAYSNHLVVPYMVSVEETSMVFNSITNHFLQVMALLIDDLSLQNCYSKGFTMNSHFHSNYSIKVFHWAKIQHFFMDKREHEIHKKFEPYGTYQPYGICSPSVHVAKHIATLYM